MRTTSTLFTATLAMFFTLSLTANPAKSQEKPVNNSVGSSAKLLSNNANSLSNSQSTNLTQDSTDRSRGKHGYSKSRLDEVTNNINLKMQNNRVPRWKSEKQWFDEKWNSFSTDF